jgi:hypothetical protein
VDHPARGVFLPAWLPKPTTGARFDRKRTGPWIGASRFTGFACRFGMFLFRAPWRPSDKAPGG